MKNSIDKYLEARTKEGFENYKKRIKNWKSYSEDVIISELYNMIRYNHYLKEDNDVQNDIIKNALYIIRNSNKQFAELTDLDLKAFLYDFDKCAKIKKEE